MITVPTILIVTFLDFYCLFICLFSFVLFLIKLLFSTMQLSLVPYL